MECLDANAVQDLMSGALDGSAKALAVKHLDGCEDCRSLISLLAKDATRDAAIETLREKDTQTDLGLRETDRAGKGKLAAMVETMHSATGVGPADPLGVTAEVSLIQRSGTRQVGKKFGRYTLVDRIGAGAMGVVYRADDPGLGRRVALKLLHKPDEALTDRLIREARSMAQVNHPNVVAVYDAGVSEGSTYIAMELVTGDSLRTWQQTKRPMPEIIETYVAAGRGLAAAHAAGIVHRDFKPDNVLVGSDGRVRVTDFGLASARPSEEMTPNITELELTHSGMVLGTPAYMAPEQFTGGNVDPRTDQFNYCVALYEALYGQRPFKGKTYDELGDNVCDGKVRPPPPGSHVSRALRAIVMRGLSVRPGDRYPTMDHLLDELGRDRARAWRNLAIVSAVLAAALGLGIGADFIVRDRVSAENDQSFTATGVQVGRAFTLLAGRFDANANQMYLQVAIRDATSHRDQADFGLGDEKTDDESLLRVREQLVSQDWALWRQVAGEELVVAVADYKGRLLFTTAAPDAWRKDLQQIPWIKAAFAEGKEKTIVLQPSHDPHLAKTQLLGPSPKYKLAFFFSRTLFLGAGTTRENSGTILQSLDAKKLIEEIRLDEKMQLSIVSPEGVNDGEVSEDLVEAARRGDAIIEVVHDGSPYQVKSQALTGLDGRSVGRVVMSRELKGVLSGFFPGARTVFSIAALLALAIALATMFQVRRLTR